MYAKGRLIREGEWLGANAFAKGSLASFYGELETEGLTPNLNKADFTERASELWEHICKEILLQAQPVLAELKGVGDPARVTDRDRRLARQVRRELETALQNLLGTRTELVTELTIHGNARTHVPGEVREATNTEAKQQRARREPVERDVLEERTKTIETPALPEIRIDSWDGPSRAETRYEASIPIIYVNKNHPGFAAASARYFIAESVILEALRSGQNGEWDVDEFCGHADEALAEWARGNAGESEGGD